MTGTEAVRRLLGRSSSFRGLMTWGSSSMAGEVPGEGPPVPCDITTHLRETIRPLRLERRAQGATQSRHTRVQMGLDTPRLEFTGGRAATAGPTRLARVLDPRSGRATTMSPTSLFRCAGSVNGTAGTLRGDGGGLTWTPDDGRTRVADGDFTATDRALVRDGDGSGRLSHLIWAGKNNVTSDGGQEVIRDVDQLVEHAGGPSRVLVLGQWVTPQDSAAAIRACGTVNRHQGSRHGEAFLDVQALLTTPAGLASPPVADLRLGDRSEVRADIRAGRVPRALVARDRIHLNGWGNLVVTWALIERMGGRGWL